MQVYNDGEMPEIYLLGSSGWSAETAAELGLSYNFAGFLNPSNAFGITQNYKDNFVQTDKAYGPKEANLSLTLFVFASDTQFPHK